MPVFRQEAGAVPLQEAADQIVAAAASQHMRDQRLTERDSASLQPVQDPLNLLLEHRIAT